MGRACLLGRGAALHRGWPTAHRAIAEAFRTHWRRWTAADRMRMLLAWVLQIRAAIQPIPHPASLWIAPSVSLRLVDIDLPYRELAAEMVADTSAASSGGGPVLARPLSEKEKKRQAAARIETQMATADAQVMALLGLGGGGGDDD